MNDSRLQVNPYLQRLKEKWFEVLAGAILVAITVTIILLAWQMSNKRSSPADYEGRIVDRWGHYSESEQGSRPQLRLLVESADGKRFTVRVDPKVFDSARVGMRIKSTGGQVALLDPEPPRTGK